LGKNGEMIGWEFYRSGGSGNIINGKVTGQVVEKVMSSDDEETVIEKWGRRQ
jgi:hypothetical protein